MAIYIDITTKLYDEIRICKTKDFKIGICCFSAKHAVFKE